MHWSILFYVIYLGIPLALLLFFGLYRPRLAPLTLLICPCGLSHFPSGIPL